MCFLNNQIRTVALGWPYFPLLIFTLDRAPSSLTNKRSSRGAFLSSSARSAPPRDIMLEEPAEEAVQASSGREILLV